MNHDLDFSPGRLFVRPITFDDYMELFPVVTDLLRRGGKVLRRIGLLIVALASLSLLTTCVAVITFALSPVGGYSAQIALSSASIGMSIAVLVVLFRWEAEKRAAMSLYQYSSDTYEWCHGAAVRPPELPVDMELTADGDPTRIAVVARRTSRQQELDVRSELRRFIQSTSLPLAGSEHAASRYAAVLLFNLFFNLALIVLLSVR